MPTGGGHMLQGEATCSRSAQGLPKDSLLPARTSLSTATILVFTVMMLVFLIISHYFNVGCLQTWR